MRVPINRKQGLLGIALTVAIAITALLVAQRSIDSSPAQAAARSDIASILAGNATQAFAVAQAGRSITFPRDHGAHPDYRIEWWYFTGNLNTTDGKRFGYQVTLFRQSSGTDESPLDSNFAGHQLWMGHLALSDVAAERYYSAERFTRGAPGLAGVRHTPFELWLEDWMINATVSARCDGCLEFTIRASADDFSLNLELDPDKPLVLHGDAGFSAKTPDGKSGSHYYSMTRLDTRGNISAGGELSAVTGTSWLDREWSSSNLGPNQVGWDWFALQLDNGQDVMIYRLRKSNGDTDAAYAVRVSPEGELTPIRADALGFTATRHWESPDGSARYPVAWRVQADGLELKVEAVMDAQMHDGLFRYWEGAVDVRANDESGDVSGVGYVELTGYATSP